MNASKRILILIIFVLFSQALISCYKNSDIEESMINSDSVQGNARYISFNISREQELEGVYELTISGTQPFDSSLYNWPEEGFDPSSDSITFLSSDRKSISRYHKWDSPYPEERSGYFNEPFEDGTFAENLAQYEAVTPLSIQKIQYVYYDKAGDRTYPDEGNYTYSDSIEMFYDESELLSNSIYHRIIIDPKDLNLEANTIMYQETAVFTENPYDGIFILSEIEYESIDYSDQLETVGNVKFDHQRTIQGTATYDTSEYSCTDSNGNISADFNNDGDTSDDSDCYGLFSDSEEYLSYSDEYYVRSSISRILNSSDNTEELSTVFYTGEFSYTEGARIIYSTVFADLDLLHRESVTTQIYETIDGSLQFSSQTKEEYQDDFLIKTITYNIETGLTRLNTTVDVSRDSDQKHIIKSIVQTNASGEVVQRQLFEYDDQGRKTDESQYDVSNDTATCDYKIVYVYDESNDQKSFSKIRYECTNGTLSSTPENEVTNIFNSKGLRVSYQKLEYNNSGVVTGGTKETWEYDETGFETKNQHYSISIESGNAVFETADYFLFNRDQNLFRTSKIHIDKAGNPCVTDEVDDAKSGVDSSFECKNACTNGSPCYRTSEYSYK